MHGTIGTHRRALLSGVASGAALVAIVGLSWLTPAPLRNEGGTRADAARSADELEARLDRARRLVDQRDLAGVWDETRYVLERSPGHPRALAYRALVLLARGQGDAAVAMLRTALEADPDLLEAHQNLAYAYARLGRTKEAEAAIADTSRRSPEEGARLKRALVQFIESSGDRPISSHAR